MSPPSKMNEEVKSLLEIEGCDIPTEDPPSDYLVAENPLVTESGFTPVDTAAIYQMSGAEGKKADEKYMAARQFYVHQIRSTKRNTLIEENLDEIKRTLASGDIDQISKLMEERHKWVSAAHRYRGDNRPVCAEKSCSHFALPGSKYCINHITNDKQQRLYVKCPTCQTVHPVIAPCPFCSSLEEKQPEE